MELKTQQIESSRIQSLAEDPRNIVYEYTHDQPTRKMEPEAQATSLRDIVASFDYLCRENSDACDEQLRDQVMAGNKKLRLFQELYPLIFASITVRAKTPEMVLRLDKVRKLSMMFIMERWKGEGDDETKHARAMHTAMRLSMRDTVASDKTASASVVQDIRMAPMSVTEFGECTVKQTRVL